MYLIVFCLPIFSAFLIFLFSNYFGRKYIFVWSSFWSVLCIFFSCFVFYEVIFFQYDNTVELFYWLSLSFINLKWCFLFDAVTIIMLTLVSIVSSLVIIYSIEYMYEDPHVARFIAYLFLFTFFMFVLITAGNLVQLFLGWEGVGLASYLLINFWFTRTQANKAAIKAVVVNRFGDFGIYIALLLMFYFFKSLDFNVIFMASYYSNYEVIHFLFINSDKVTLLALFLFLGTIGKSAQLGLHTWLPDAMEGPTPVSALIHAATMVTAGIYVLIRCSIIFEQSPYFLMLVALIGSLTSFFSGTIGMFQYDLKKVIAYSTCSQLGYMVFSCGSSNYATTLYHLFNHGFFKALLFLGAGALIHALQDEQDIRRMGGLFKVLPFVYVVFSIGSLSLSGIPFLTGFYSKDIIIEFWSVKFFLNSLFIYYFSIISVAITTYYSMRLLFFIFFDSFNGYFFSLKYLHEPGTLITIALFILSIFSIFVGFVFKDLFIGLGVDTFGNSIFINLINNILLDSEFVNMFVKLLPIYICFSCIWFFVYLFQPQNYVLFILSLINNFIFVHIFFIKKWFFDLIYNNIFVKNTLYFSYNIAYKIYDRGLIEYFGPLGITKLLKALSYNINKLQTGFLYHYIFVVILSIIIILFYICINANVYVYININMLLIIFGLISVYFFLYFFYKFKIS